MLLREPRLSRRSFSLHHTFPSKKERFSRFCFSLLSPILPQQQLPSYVGKRHSVALKSSRRENPFQSGVQADKKPGTPPEEILL